MNQLINVLSKDALGKVEKEVPFIKGLKATFYADVPGNFGEQLEKKRKELGDSDAGYWSTIQSVADWNFADGKEKKLPINIESLKKLPLKLQKWIFEQSQSIVFADDEAKKKLPASSSKR